MPTQESVENTLSQPLFVIRSYATWLFLVSRQGRDRHESKRKNLFLTALCLVYLKFLSPGVPFLKLHFLLRCFKAKDRERLLGWKGQAPSIYTPFSAVFGSQRSWYAGSRHPYGSTFCLCAFWKHKIRVISLLLKWPASQEEWEGTAQKNLNEAVEEPDTRCEPAIVVEKPRRTPTERPQCLPSPLSLQTGCLEERAGNTGPRQHLLHSPPAL